MKVMIFMHKNKILLEYGNCDRTQVNNKCDDFLGVVQTADYKSDYKFLASHYTF